MARSKAAEKNRFDCLAIGAHPDDAELSCGGTLALLIRAGRKVAIADLTRGEMGSRGSLAERNKEKAAASRKLGIAARFDVGLPDGRFEVNDASRRAVVKLLRQTRPRLVLHPYPVDRHPDHERVGQLVRECVFYSNVQKFLPRLPRFKPSRSLAWFGNYHGALPAPTLVVDITEVFSLKMEVIALFKSQVLNPDYKGEETYISSENFWKLIEARARYFGTMIGATYGEPFWSETPVAIRDVESLFRI
ncbi:MAG: bacillithiol biosynthesis deacetylase BshB1 [bacterium]